jgi:hypothetical protein
MNRHSRHPQRRRTSSGRGRGQTACDHNRRGARGTIAPLIWSGHRSNLTARRADRSTGGTFKVKRQRTVTVAVVDWVPPPVSVPTTQSSMGPVRPPRRTMNVAL